MTLRKHNYKLQLKEHKDWLKTELTRAEICIKKSFCGSSAWQKHIGEARAYRAAIKNLEDHERQKQEADEQIKAARARERKRRSS